MSLNTLESRIEEELARRASEELGLRSLKLNVKGRRGYPDRLFFVPGGKPTFIELKRPGEQPRPLQKHIHKILRKLGYHVETHSDVQRALACLKKAIRLNSLTDRKKS